MPEATEKGEEKESSLLPNPKKNAFAPEKGVTPKQRHKGGFVSVPEC
jgi:hypothetical protein